MHRAHHGRSARWMAIFHLTPVFSRIEAASSARQPRPFVVVADRFDSKGTGESVGGCCSPTNWFGRSLAFWARLRTRVNTPTCMCASAASTFTRFFCAHCQPPACVSAPRVRTGCLLVEEIISNWIQDLKIGRSWMELFKVLRLLKDCIRIQRKIQGRSFKFERNSENLTVEVTWINLSFEI